MRDLNGTVQLASIHLQIQRTSTIRPMIRNLIYQTFRQ